MTAQSRSFAARPHAAWTPTEYLLFGRYCEAEAIEAHVSRLREQAQAEAALLIAFRGETLFHSLLLPSHRHWSMTHRHRGRLAALAARPGPIVSTLTDFELARVAPEQFASALRAQSPFSSVAPLLSGPVAILSRSPAVGPAAADRGIVPAAIHVVLNTPGVALPCEAVDAAMDELLYMVNASAPVVVHGNLLAEQDVETTLERLDPAVTEQLESFNHAQQLAQLDPSALPRLMLEAALELTGSSVGNVYFDTKDADLALEAEIRNVRPRRTIPFDDPKSVVAWVYRRRRPRVINDARDFMLMHPGSGHTSGLASGQHAFAELAVPIVQARLRTGAGATIGVINVEKVRPFDRGYFTYRDVTILRLIANRLSMWRTQMLLSRFSSSLADLTRRNALSSPVTLHGSYGDGCAGIPPDALPAKGAIDETLQMVADLTRSRSATVRLLSLDQRTLVRFAAYPPSCMDDRHAQISIRDFHSVNAWVARAGEHCYLDRTKFAPARRRYKRLDGYLEVREGTRSELCLPIFVGGRITGTLNLESRFPYGYEDTLDTAHAIVEQVGLAIQHARRAQEQQVFSMTIAATANQHQIFRQVRELRKRAGADVEIHGIANEILRLIVPGTADVVDAPLTTEAILAEVLEELNFDGIFERRNAPAVSIAHTGTRTLILRVVFEELLRNAHRQMLRSQLEGWLRWNSFDAGGREYLALSIGNRVPRAMRAHTAECLYRVPVRFPLGRRLHIGAYTSGALMRSLGGDVHIEHNRSRWFIARVHLPVALEAPATDRSGGEA
ncbi:MAG: GAF domain-containing protein [Actinobacteria bacterium]|nr:GAF domain-containing protein [Actinomycetota bacterium]